MVRHPLVNRTSPLGQPFVGTCAACGMTDITSDRLTKLECPNVRDMTPKDAILEAILGPKGK